MSPAVEVINVYKSFKGETVLKGVSVSFERGQIHGIMGRNGSGKTVLFKCICGFLEVDSGEILIEGKKVKPSEAHDVGIILETPGFIESLSGMKNLKLLSSLNRRIGTKEVEEAIRTVGLDPKSRKHVGKYSLGMKHRLGIAQAIMERPDILILDEPMNGLDKRGVLEMRELFTKLSEQGVTIIMSSHYAEDIDALCKTTYEMDGGVLTRVV